MYFPVLGEAVWVGGCPEQFTVIRVDYATCVAIIAPDQEILRKSEPLRLQFAPSNHKEETADNADVRITQNILHSSRACLDRARRVMADVRETIRATQTTISQSQALLAENDATIERMKILDCNHKRWNNGGSPCPADGASSG